MDIKDRIKSERLRLSLNQTDFAMLAGVSKNSQSNYENGVRKPDSDYLQALAKAGVNVEYIITGVHTETPALSPRIAALIKDLERIDDADRRCLEQLARSLALAVISKKESD